MKRIQICLIIALFFIFTSITATEAKIDRNLYDALDVLAKEYENSKYYAENSDSSELLKITSGAHTRALKDVEQHLGKLSTPEDIRVFFSTVNVFLQTKRGIPFSLAAMKAAALLEERSKFLITSGESTESLEILQNGVAQLKTIDLNNTKIPKSGHAEFSKATATKTESKGLPTTLLGANVTTKGTSFQVYSPRATKCNLILYKAKADKQGKVYPMKKSSNGIWKMGFDKDLTGFFYKYQVDGPKAPGERFDPKNLLSDPYAKCNVSSGGKSIVVNDKYTWKSTFRKPKIKDLVIYEMHIKDYTAHSSSGVTGAKKGNYLGLLEGKSSDKVLGNLIELGVNAVELLPVQEFDNKAAPSGVNHWGYMTTHFFAPETSYSSGDAGIQIQELKKLIDGLHANGIAVIMDVVYNHTAEGNEEGPSICYKGFDNKAYYRLYTNPDQYWNGTGCGNEFRSEHPATRKLIIDSLKYWVKEYKIDGFRFDLATIIDKQTMTEIDRQLPKGVYLISEPWAADWSRNQWTKNDFRNTRWAKWNDDYKLNIRKFIRGNADRNNVMTVIAGSCYWWTAKPTESINFIECHDNGTLMDYLGNWEKGALFGMGVLLTSQGVPMLHEGQEFLKNKFGNENSYDQDNKTNYINWNLKKKNRKAFDFVSGLVKLRLKYEHFRKNTPLNNNDIVWLLHSNTKALGYHLKGKSCNILVLLNSDPKNQASFNLPDSNDWTILCNGDKVADDGSLGTAKGTYNLHPTQIIILKKKN